MSRKHFLLRFLLTLALLFIAACSSSKVENGPDTNRDQSRAAPPGVALEQDKPMERKIIYQASLSVSVDDVDKAAADLYNKALVLGGYVANSSRNSAGESPFARITYRIPQGHYPDFLGFARGLGEADNETIDSTDVTEEFVDLEARLLSLKAHETRLLAMYELGQSIEELLALERELARVRGEIETIEGRLRYLEENVDMALVTVYLSKGPGVTEIPGIKPMGIEETLRRALKAVVNSFTFLLNVLSYGLVVLAASLPFAIPALALVIIFIRLRRKRKKTETTP